MGRRKKVPPSEEESKENGIKADEIILETAGTSAISAEIDPTRKATPKKKSQTPATRDNAVKSSKKSVTNIADDQVDGAMINKAVDESSKEKVKRAYKKHRVDEMFIPETVAEEILFERSEVNYQEIEEEPFKKAKKLKAPVSAKKEKKVVEKKVVEKKSTEKKVVERKHVERKVSEKKEAAQAAGPYLKYSSARAKWMNNTLKNLSVSEGIKALQSVDIVIDSTERHPDMQSVLFHEWVYANSVLFTPDSALTIIVEDLGANNAIQVQALTSTAVPRYSEAADGMGKYPSSVYDYDVILNASGPVWALALSDTPQRSPQSLGRDIYYLAVGTTQVGFPPRHAADWGKCNGEEVGIELPFTLDGRGGTGSDFVRVVGKEENSPNLIQVWSLCYEQSSFAPPIVSLQYFVELSGRGSVWSLSWSVRDICIGTGEGGSAEGDETARWGVLAAVCGDGSCLIFMLPKNSVQDDRTESSSTDHIVYSERSSCRYELRVGQLLVTSAEWCPSKPLTICCGLSDGSLAIWTLDALEMVPGHKDEVPKPAASYRFVDVALKDSIACHCAVRAVRFCPYAGNEDLILSVGYDSDITIWQMGEQYRPLFRKSTQFSHVLDAQWDPLGFGLYLSESGKSTLILDNLWCAFEGEKKTLYSHASKCSCIWAINIFELDYQTFVITVASDGTVRGGFPSLLTSRASLPPLDLFRILSVEESEATSSASGEPDVVVTVRRDARLEHANHEDAMFTRNLALSMHTVHSVAVLGDDRRKLMDIPTGRDEDGEPVVDATVQRRLVVYGGAAGLVRISCIYPIEQQIR